MAASTAKNFDFNFNINDYSELMGLSYAGSAAPKKAPERKLPERPHIVKEKPRSKKDLKRAAKLSRLATLRVLAVSCVILVLLGIIIFGRVMIEEYASQADKLTAMYEESVSENVRLKSEVASMYSIGNISEYAENELGMVKKNDYQPNYYSVD